MNVVRFAGRKGARVSLDYHAGLAAQCGALPAALKCLLINPDNRELQKLCQVVSDDFDAWWKANRPDRG